MTISTSPDEATTGALRRGLVALAGLGAVGTAVELAMLRHWHGAAQLVPWLCVGLVAAAAVALVARPTRRTVRAVRALAALVTLGALLGVYEHVAGNHAAGPLDFRYADRWEAMSEASRWWAAASGAVGPAPALAPGVLVQASTCLLLATLGHPALAPRRSRPDDEPAPEPTAFPLRRRPAVR